MLSRFDKVPERVRQMDRQTDRQNCYINIARQCALAQLLSKEKKFVINDHVILKFTSDVEQICLVAYDRMLCMQGKGTWIYIAP